LTLVSLTADQVPISHQEHPDRKFGRVSISSRLAWRHRTLSPIRINLPHRQAFGDTSASCRSQL